VFENGSRCSQAHRVLDKKDVVVATIDGQIVFSKIVVGVE